MYAVHRVDLHQELLRLASDENDGDRIPAKLHLGSSVTKVYLDKGVVELEDGSMYEGDFVIAADGLRSVIRDAAVVRDVKPVASGMSAFWFLIATDRLRKDPALDNLLQWKSQGATIFVDSTGKFGHDRRQAVWYGCRG